MTLLWLKNIFFTILQPGMVIGLIPYLILKPLSIDWRSGIWFRCFGILILSFGITFLLLTIYQLALQGNGTLSPLSPTKNLANKGCYQYSRNPMYISVIIALIGMTLTTLVLPMVIYTFLIIGVFHLFVIFREEPRLTKSFGQSYIDYQSKVRRWI